MIKKTKTFNKNTKLSKKNEFLTNKNSIIITQKDGYKTLLEYYPSNENLLGTVLILHGMAEHHHRYQLFIQFLNTNSYDVYTYDHRGHGINQKISELGYFSKRKGYNKVTFDAINIINYIQSNNNHQLFVFGHSMGSIILRNVLQIKDDFNGAIICGSSHPPFYFSTSGIIFASFLQFILGAKHISPLLNSLLFGRPKFIKLIKNTPFDWLTRDTLLVKCYIEDSHCGFLCTTSFYKDLAILTKRAGIRKRVKKTRKDLPILIISGKKDPVSSYSSEIINLVNMYKKLEFTSISCKLYKDARHEILNETNKYEVMEDILSWLNNN